MKTRCQIMVGLAVVATASGCASTKAYFVDRGRDAADIATVTIGTGGGTRVRVGPVHAGAVLNFGRFGVDGGQCGRFNISYYHHSLPECSNETTEIELPVPLPSPEPKIAFSAEVRDFDGTPRERGKNYVAHGSLPFVTTYFGSRDTHVQRPHPYFSQIEVVVGLGITAKLGFNPGELLDFLLGWTAIDIFNDDLEARREKETSNKTPEDIRR